MSQSASPMTPERMLLLAEISALHAAYGHCIDDDRLESWPGFFTDECEYQIIPRENEDLGLPAAIMFCDNRRMLVDRVVALRKANIYPAHYSRHVLGPPMLLAGDEDGGWCCRTSYLLLQTRSDGHARAFSAGRYEDRIVRREGELKFQRRRVIFDTHQIETLLATPI